MFVRLAAAMNDDWCVGANLDMMQLFRSAHRTRSLVYLRQPAPERFPMTAGKSMLSSDLEQSLEVLDEFMVTRLKQTA